MLDGSAPPAHGPAGVATRAPLHPALVIYEGYPSWKAWFWSYLAAGILSFVNALWLQARYSGSLFNIIGVLLTPFFFVAFALLCAPSIPVAPVISLMTGPRTWRAVNLEMPRCARVLSKYSRATRDK